MRTLYPDVFTTVKPYGNPKLDMDWKRPTIVIEAPGTTPYGPFLHWHRRCMRDKNYVGFLDLLLSTRGIKDNIWGPVQVDITDTVNCQMPFMIDDCVTYKTFEGTAEEAYDKRIEFATELFKNKRSAIIRHYAETVHPAFDNKQRQVEGYFFKQARLVFIEKKIDPVFNLVRMAQLQNNLSDDEYEISKEQFDWFLASMKRYQGTKQYWIKHLPDRVSVIDIETLMKSSFDLTWTDKVKAKMEIPKDDWAKAYSFPLIKYRSPQNFKQIDEWFRAAWR